MNARIAQELTRVVTELLRKEKQLPPGKKAVIQISFVDHTAVEIRNGVSTEEKRPITQKDRSDLARVLKRMPTSGERMANALTNDGISGLSQIADNEAYNPAKLRGIGRSTVREFAESLKAEGVELAWVENTLRPSLYHQQLDACVVKRLRSADWDAIRQGKWDEIQKHAIDLLWARNNKPIGLGDIGGKMGLEGEGLMRNINLRLGRLHLPYRLKFVSKESPNKLEWLLQIAHMPS